MVGFEGGSETTEKRGNEVEKYRLFSTFQLTEGNEWKKRHFWGFLLCLKKKMWVLKLALDFFPPQIWGLFWGGEVAVGKMQWGQNQGKIIWKTRRTTAKMLENGARKDGDV